MQARRQFPAMPTVLFPGSEGRPFPLLSDLVVAYGRGQLGPAMLYLGDSSVLRVAHQDQDQRPLGQMVQDALGGPDQLLWSAGSAHQPELWQEALRLFKGRLAHRPDTLLLPINPRIFSSQWSGNPLWALSAEREILAGWQPSRMVPPVPAVTGSPQLFAFYDRRSAGLRELGRLGDLRRLAALGPSQDPKARDDRLRRLLRWHYGEPLLSGHPRLDALAATCKIALAAGIQVVAYVTPVNVGAAGRLCGESLLDRLRANIALVRQALPAELTFADLHDFLPEAAFFHGNLATEHLAESGRTSLTARIAGLVAETAG